MDAATVSRRDFSKMAAGLGLSFCLPGLDARAAQRRGGERPRSLITVWLAGGPSQLETWDPHPGTTIGGPTRSIRTSLAGVEIAEHYPRLAERIHHLSVIRSLVSREGDHARGMYYLKTGYTPDPTVRHPSLGAIVSREVAVPGLEIPGYISLGHDPYSSAGGYLGGMHDAFRIPEPGEESHHLRPQVNAARQQRRLGNLQVATQAFARGRRATLDRTLHQHAVDAALRMMTSEQVRAFEIQDEPQATRTAYGTTPFGRGCLVARRLVEIGVSAVDITLPGFDSHEGNFEAHRDQAAILDPALAALVQDLHERDLLQSTMLLCIGEFGRTPRVNFLEGRDHWPNGFSCLIGGGGVRGGLLIGSTDPTGQRAEPTDPIRVPDFYATILRALGIPHQRNNPTPIGRPIRYSEGRPLDRLLA